MVVSAGKNARDGAALLGHAHALSRAERLNVALFVLFGAAHVALLSRLLSHEVAAQNERADRLAVAAGIIVWTPRDLVKSGARVKLCRRIVGLADRKDLSLIGSDARHDEADKLRSDHGAVREHGRIGKKLLAFILAPAALERL